MKNGFDADPEQLLVGRRRSAHGQPSEFKRHMGYGGMSQERSSWMFAGWRIGLYCLFAVLTVCMALTACATGPVLPDHAFSFDAVRESPDAEVLNYRYGDSRMLAAHAQEGDLQRGTVRQGTNINGPMLRGDFLYVKWRIKRSGKEYEDRVDLRSLLPADIQDHRIHFVIKGPQLYVYLISPERNPPDWPTYDPPGYTHKKTYQIYPNQPAKK